MEIMSCSTRYQSIFISYPNYIISYFSFSFLFNFSIHEFLIWSIRSCRHILGFEGKVCIRWGLYLVDYRCRYRLTMTMDTSISSRRWWARPLKKEPLSSAANPFASMAKKGSSVKEKNHLFKKGLWETSFLQSLNNIFI